MIPSRIERLVSLPPSAAGHFAELQPYPADGVFAASDPPAAQLGSAGGTAHLLHAAWRAAAAGADAAPGAFADWLQRSRKLIIHGSGESRRLPAYAALGKPLTPLPPLRGMAGQRPDQVLLDLQIATYERLFRCAPAVYRLMVACGDVLLRHAHWLPRYPEADLLIVGFSASPEEASRHGVLVCPPGDPGRLQFFLQKPDPEQVRALSRTRAFYIDTGVWLFSRRGVETLMRKCGWDPARERFVGDRAAPYELYAGVGPALGETPTQADPDFSGLTCAVLSLPDGRFYHFGTNRSLLASAAQLQRPSDEQRSFGHGSLADRPAPLILHSDVRCPVLPRHHHIWIDNSVVAEGWLLSERHILTGIPPQAEQARLEPGTCLDFAPLGERRLCARFYGFDDEFRGPLAAEGTLWLGRPAAQWFGARRIAWADAGLDPDGDVYDAPLFPVVDPDDMPAPFLAWLLGAMPPEDAALRQRWLRSPRLSARDLLTRSDVVLQAAARRNFTRAQGERQDPAAWLAGCSRLDLAATATLYRGEGWPLPSEPADDPRWAGVGLAHDRMFRAAALRRRDPASAARHEAEAFGVLRRLIVDQLETEPVYPARNVLDDQIVWGRSPIRFDLAGGWTDTPPYCLEHGGRVVNVAADLNGQPPIQVFGRLTEQPEIVLRSIDLGVDERVTTYEELARYGQLGSSFGVARAALALAGLEPRFHGRGGYASLRDQLARELGGGLDLSMLAAVPKGSGLGTSSILAATILGTLSELLGLHWSLNDLFLRTLALEQMLTSGGGWQDQIGGVTHAIKLIETGPGLRQVPVIRWLPGEFFGPGHANRDVVLYYTGLTRVAHDILSEIVRGLFLNSVTHLGLIEDIGANAAFAADAIQRNDRDGLCEAVRRSWHLNQLLDGGTNPPEVQAIVDRIGDWTAACKLLGAGGGGYMLILAKDAEAAERIRKALSAAPPNRGARFVALALSETGFQVTRS